MILCHYDLLAGKILYNRSFWLNRYLKVGDASLLTGSRWNPKSSINIGVRKFTLPCQLKFGFLENLRFWVCTFEYCCSALQVICNRNLYATEKVNFSTEKKYFSISKLAKKNELFLKIGHFSAIFGEHRPFLEKIGHFSAIFEEMTYFVICWSAFFIFCPYGDQQSC